MTQISRNDIEHPIQPDWIKGYAESLDRAHSNALKARFRDSGASLEFIVSSLQAVTAYNHAHRVEHEADNLHKLDLVLPTRKHYSDKQVSTTNQATYESLAGRSDKIGDFVAWFSTVSHEAFVRQEILPPKERFQQVSLELGGKRQYGDWEATIGLDAMVRSVPARLLRIRQDATMVVYGDARRADRLVDDRVSYVDDVEKSYTVFPRYSTETNVMTAAMLRRRRPVADIYLPGESDIVLFKESIVLLLPSMMDPDLHSEFDQNCTAEIAAAKTAYDIARKRAEKDEHQQIPENNIKLQDTEAAKLAGRLFELAIGAPRMVTRDIVPVSAHCVQGVGEKYAKFRQLT